MTEVDIAIIGGGATGIAAARKLAEAGADAMLIEARDRLGGRALTVSTGGHTLDLGCGWLHSADRNPWTRIAEAAGVAIDRGLPPWQRPAMDVGFPPAEQRQFREVFGAAYERFGDFPEVGPDRPASELLEPGNRWNPLIGAISSFLSGTEPERVSARDFARYDDTGVNWRVPMGYGRLIVGHASGLRVALGTAVRMIDRTRPRLRIGTDCGDISARAAIVTLPTNVIATEAVRFVPPLPDKAEAAAGLPLGLADKLFLSLDGAEEFPAETRLFGRVDRTATAAYHFRPFERPVIEAYFGGACAADLENEGMEAFFEFTRAELSNLFGSGFARRIHPLACHRWASDPLALGSYSCAPRACRRPRQAGRTRRRSPVIRRRGLLAA